MRKALASLVLAAFWTLFIGKFGSDHGTFDSKWGDNVSNISSAYLFLHEGLKISTRPLVEMVEPLNSSAVAPRFKTDLRQEWWYYSKKAGVDKPLFFVTPEVPRPYPPGAWLLYLPFALLVYWLGFSFSTVALASTFVFLLIAHICFFMFYQRLNSQVPREKSLIKGLFWFIVFTAYSEFVMWSGQGQYDLIAMLFLFFCIDYLSAQKWPRAFLFFSLAFSFHFRSVFFSGALVRGLVRVKNILNWQIVAAAVLGSLSFYVLFTNLSFLTNVDFVNLNKYHYSVFLAQDLLVRTVYFLVFGGLIVFYLRHRLWEQLGVTLTTTLVLITTRAVRSWYTLFLFPIFLLPPREAKNQSTLFAINSLFYIFYSSLFLTESPFEFTFLREIYRCLAN